MTLIERRRVNTAYNAASRTWSKCSLNAPFLARVRPHPFMKATRGSDVAIPSVRLSVCHT